MVEEKAGAPVVGPEEIPDKAAVIANKTAIIQPKIQLHTGGDTMPGFDRTGPMSAGPMTGGRRGFCKPATAGAMPPDTGNTPDGRCLGLRRGFRGGNGPGMDRGYGRGYGWYPHVSDPVYPVETASEISMLKAQVNDMKSALDEINKYIRAMEKKTTEGT